MFDTTESQVTETSSETAVTTTETVETPVETTASLDDVWSTEFPTEPAAEDERAESDAPNPSDVSPSSESEEVKEENPDDQAEVKEIDNEELSDKEMEEAISKLPSPARKKLRYLEKTAEPVVNAFRDTETPITSFVDALRDLNPTRAEQLVNTIVSESATAYPNEWLKVILGDETATVESVKQALTAPKAESAPISTDDPILQKVVGELDELYGEEWRTDDSIIMDDDLAFVNKVREQLKGQAEAVKYESEEIAKLKAELAEAKPQIEKIVSEQEKAHQDAITSKYSEWSAEYEKTIESAVLPSIIKANGLEDNPNDTEKVKLAKAEARSKFENKSYDGISDFERFLLNGFSQKDNLTKILNRVGLNLKNAAVAETDATREKDNTRAERLRKDAQALRAEAEREQDVITVLTKNASKEFLKATGNVTMSLIEENTQLRQQLAKLTGNRAEIVGQAVVGGNSFASKMDEFVAKGANPFDVDVSDFLPR